MKQGDLVKYVSTSNRWEWDNTWDKPGIIIRCIPGTDERKVVIWSSGGQSCLPARNLEVINESR